MTAALDPIRIRQRLRLSGVLIVLAVLALGGFLALNAVIAYLVVSGALDGRWYDFRDLGIAMSHLHVYLDEISAQQPQAVTDILGAYWLSVGSPGTELEFAL